MKKIKGLTDEQIVKLFENKKMLYHFTIYLGIDHDGKSGISSTTLGSSKAVLTEEQLEKLLLRAKPNLKEVKIAVLMVTPKIKIAHMFHKSFIEFMSLHDWIIIKPSFFSRN